MKVDAVFTPQARVDLESAQRWYERHREGLGERFITTVLAAVDRIRASPRQYFVHLENLRTCSLRECPYVIYYTIDDDAVIVIAVLHRGRDNWVR